MIFHIFFATLSAEKCLREIQTLIHRSQLSLDFKSQQKKLKFQTFSNPTFPYTFFYLFVSRKNFFSSFFLFRQRKKRSTRKGRKMEERKTEKKLSTSYFSLFFRFSLFHGHKFMVPARVFVLFIICFDSPLNFVTQFLGRSNAGFFLKLWKFSSLLWYFCLPFLWCFNCCFS